MASCSAVASRFAYDVLTGEDEAGRAAPGAKRGKDGHVQLGSAGDDFFAKPLSGAPKGPSKCAAMYPSLALLLSPSDAPRA